MNNNNYMLHSGIIQSFIYNLHTGNVLLDTLISLLVTSFFSYIIMNSSSFCQRTKGYLKPFRRYFCCCRHQYVRNIKSLADYDVTHGDWEEDTILTDCANIPLINAVFYWLHKHNLKLENNDVQLMIKDSNIESDVESDYEIFKNRNVVSIPEEGVRCKISDKLEIDYTTNNIRNKNERSKEISLTLYSPDKKYVDDFIMECWNLYIEECHRKKDDKKYFYTIESISLAKNKINCSQYDCPNTKKLEHVFIPEIAEIKQLIDHFMNKTGPFSNPFFPYKLGWIFHGIRGCGKTSLIKAIAKYTGRQIINVSFANINTNAELFRLFFNPTIFSDGKQKNYKISDVIYVIDDLDAIDDIIRNRLMNSKKQRQIRTEDSEDIEDESDDSESGTVAEKYSLTAKKIKPVIIQKTKPLPPDALNLQGILSVFDGTLDSPARMVVMTTNYLDRIDPALKRPGRINQIIEFSEMTKRCTIDYINACFQITLTEEQCDRIPNKKLTPANIEEICIENYKDVPVALDKINAAERH